MAEPLLESGMEPVVEPKVEARGTGSFVDPPQLLVPWNPQSERTDASGCVLHLH